MAVLRVFFQCGSCMASGHSELRGGCSLKGYCVNGSGDLLGCLVALQGHIVERFDCITGHSWRVTFYLPFQ